MLHWIGSFIKSYHIRRILVAHSKLHKSNNDYFHLYHHLDGVKHETKPKRFFGCKLLYKMHICVKEHLYIWKHLINSMGRKTKCVVSQMAKNEYKLVPNGKQSEWVWPHNEQDIPVEMKEEKKNENEEKMRMTTAAVVTASPTRTNKSNDNDDDDDGFIWTCIFSSIVFNGTKWVLREGYRKKYKKINTMSAISDRRNQMKQCDKRHSAFTFHLIWHKNNNNSADKSQWEKQKRVTKEEKNVECATEQ